MICPNCKEGYLYIQTTPKTFFCRHCGFKLEFSEDWSIITVTLNGKTWCYPRDGWFETK